MTVGAVVLVLCICGTACGAAVCASDVFATAALKPELLKRDSALSARVTLPPSWLTAEVAGC